MTEENLQQQAQELTIEKFSDKELTTLLRAMEEDYPMLSRLPYWKLIGFQKNINIGGSNVPIYVKTWYDDSRYPPAKLRELRKIRGVGAKENKKHKKDRALVLTEMVRLNQEMGLYDETLKNPLDKNVESV